MLSNLTLKITIDLSLDPFSLLSSGDFLILNFQGNPSAVLHSLGPFDKSPKNQLSTYSHKERLYYLGGGGGAFMESRRDLFIVFKEKDDNSPILASVRSCKSLFHRYSTTGNCGNRKLNAFTKLRYFVITE